MQNLFGHPRVVATDDSAGAVGAAVEVNGYLKRPPAISGRIAAKVADGAVAELSPTEREHLDLLGIQVERVTVTDGDRTKAFDSAMAEGIPEAIATVKALSLKGGYRATVPVSLKHWFRPA